MRNRFRFRLATIIIVLFFVIIGSESFAQAPPPGSNPPGAPIDGLVALLVFAGAGYGSYRFNAEGK